MTNKIVYPGIVPAVSYSYCPAHTQIGLTSRTLKTAHGDEFDDTLYSRQSNARFTEYRVLYAICTYMDRSGEERVAEGGVMWRMMYDFCGGIMATSAWAITDRHPMNENMWGDSYWKTIHLGPNMTAAAQKQVRSALDSSKWAEWKDKLPKMSTFTGKESMAPADAKKVIVQSIAGALVATAHKWGRRGVYAADRFNSCHRTRDVIRAMADVTFYYPWMVTVDSWANSSAGPRPVVYNENERTDALCTYVNSSEYFDGEPFTNPNSGASVSMCHAVVRNYRSSPRDGLSPEDSGWSAPGELGKLTNPDLFSFVVPHGLFHNG